MTEPEDLTAEQFARWWKETGERELRQILCGRFSRSVAAWREDRDPS